MRSVTRFSSWLPRAAPASRGGRTVIRDGPEGRKLADVSTRTRPAQASALCYIGTDARPGRRLRTAYQRTAATSRLRPRGGGVRRRGALRLPGAGAGRPLRGGRRERGALPQPRQATLLRAQPGHQRADLRLHLPVPGRLHLAGGALRVPRRGGPHPHRRRGGRGAGAAPAGLPGLPPLLRPARLGAALDLEPAGHRPRRGGAARPGAVAGGRHHRARRPAAADHAAHRGAAAAGAGAAGAQARRRRRARHRPGAAARARRHRARPRLPRAARPPPEGRGVITALVSIALLGRVGSSLPSPIETLGWWAGWYGQGLEDPGPPAPPENRNGGPEPSHFLLYLDGIANVGGYHYHDVHALLDG